MLFAYIGTLAWQVIWLGLLPQPVGPKNFWLLVVACLPLLLPLRGIIRTTHRSMVYGGIVLLIYFTVGVTEIWTNEAHLWPAVVQIILVLIYFFAFRKHMRAG